MTYKITVDTFEDIVMPFVNPLDHETIIDYFATVERPHVRTIDDRDYLVFDSIDEFRAMINRELDIIEIMNLLH